MATDMRHEQLRETYHRTLRDWYALSIPRGRAKIQPRLDAARAAFVADCGKFETRVNEEGYIESFRVTT